MEWPGIGKATATDRLYSPKVAYLIFKNAAPILQKAHCHHYKDEPENVLYLGGKTLFFWESYKIENPALYSGNLSKSTVQFLFRESYKIRNPTVYSGNHSKSTFQLFVQGIIQNPQSNCLFRESQNQQSSSLSRESYKIHNPLFWKTHGLLLKRTLRALTTLTYRYYKNWRCLLPVLCLQRYCACITMTASLNSTACSTWVVLPSRLSLWLHQQSYGSLPRPNPSPWATARLSFVSLFMIGLVACLFCNDNSTPLSPPAPFLSLYQSHPEAITGAWDSLSNLFLNKIYCEFCGSEVNIWFK